MVFRQLADRGLWFAHASGISRVRLLPDTIPVIYLDRVGGGLSRSYPSQRTAIDTVLPVAEPDIQVNGVLGLRVVSAVGADLTVGLFGTDARLILRAAGKGSWSKLLRQRAQELVHEFGCVPVWDAPALTEHERQHLDKYGWRPVDTDLAWIGSALLRRIGILNTISNAYSTRVWTNHDHWVIETSTRRDVALAHTELLCWLSDPVWGVGLRIRRSSCDCRADTLYDTVCRFDLQDLGDRAGGLQLRFHHERHDDPIEPRRTLSRVAATTGWLNRVLPQPPGADGIETPDLKSRRRQWITARAE